MAGIREDVEKRFYEFLGDVVDKIGVERVQTVLEGALSGAAKTKEAVDKNFENLLSLANIPTRRDFERMRSKIDALQGSVLTLTRTVDELREKLATANGASHAAYSAHASSAAPLRPTASPTTPRSAAAAKSKPASGTAAKRGGTTGTKRGR